MRRNRNSNRTVGKLFLHPDMAPALSNLNEAQTPQGGNDTLITQGGCFRQELPPAVIDDDEREERRMRLGLYAAEVRSSIDSVQVQPGAETAIFNLPRWYSNLSISRSRRTFC